MSDVLKDGLTWLAAQQRSFMSESATYRRGTKSVSLPVTLGRADADLNEFGGVTLRTAEKVFWIRPADLVLAGDETLPIAGDTLDLEENGQTVRYRVPEAGKNEPAYVWDEFRTQFRVTAKFQKVL